MGCFFLLLLLALILRLVNDYNPRNQIIFIVIIMVQLAVSLKYHAAVPFMLFTFICALQVFNLYLFDKTEGENNTIETSFIKGQIVVIYSMIPMLLMRELFLKFLSVIFCLTITYIRFANTVDLYSNFGIAMIYAICLIILIGYRIRDVRTFSKNEYAKQAASTLTSIVNEWLPVGVIIILKETKKIVFYNQSFKTDHFPNQIITLDNLKTQIVVKDPIEEKEYTFGEIVDRNLQLKKRSFRKYYGDSLERKMKYEITFVAADWNGEDSLIVVFNDVTQQELAVTLKAADKHKDNVIAVVSHEIRNPLTGIIGMLNLLLQKGCDIETKKYAEMAFTSAKILLNLVNSLLDYDQIKNRTIKLNFEYVGLKPLVDEVRSPMSVVASKKGIYLDLDIDSSAPGYLYTDKNRLQQILMNLVGNAIKFTFEGSVTIKIALDPTNSELLEFSVVDTGIGISQENIPKLFRKYGRVGETASINKTGAGLGLMISESLVRALAGEKDQRGIRVESELGKGSKFSFSIGYLKKAQKEEIDRYETHPTSEANITDIFIREFEETSHLNAPPEFLNKLARSRDPLPSIHIIDADLVIDHSGDNLFERGFERGYYFDDPLRSSSIRMKGSFMMSSVLRKGSYASTKPSALIGSGYFDMRQNSDQDLLLFVDDDPFNLVAVSTMAREMGLNAKTALNGKAGIQLVEDQIKEKHFFKIIFLDCIMPIMDGYETARILKEKMNNNEIPKVPIIALTAHSSKNEEKKCLAAGMDSFIVKPINQKNLREVLEKFYIR